MEAGTIVRSTAGRDKGRLLCVVGEEDGYALVSDGKERPLERPKKKNRKHIQEVGCRAFTWQIRGNKALRKALNRLNAAMKG